MIPILDELEYLLYIFETVLIMLAIVIVIHSVMFMLVGYAQTGDAFSYLRIFYHNVYHIDF